MANNRLFNFIEQQYHAGKYNETLEKIQLIANKGKSYFLIDLPVEEQVLKTTDGVFTLSSHHISIHKKMNNSTAVLSEYHYTGFLERAGVKYRLHVYFDTSDRMWEPQFSIESQDTETGWANFPMLELNQQFKQLARTHAFPFIKQVKEELRERVDQLRAEHAQRDKLASDLSAQSLVSEEYKEALAAIEETLVLLLPLDKQKRINELRLISKMKSVIEERLTKKVAAQAESLPLPEETKAETEADEESPVTVAPVRKRRARVKCSREEKRFNQKIDDFKIQADFLISLKLDIEVEDLLKLYGSIQAHIVRLEDKTEGQEKRPKLKNISIAKLAELRAIEQNVRNCGEALLHQLLLQKRFEEAEKLKPFHFSFSKEKLLNDPSYEKDTQLLQFLMTHCGLALNHPITIAGQNYDSLFVYLIPAQSESLDSIEAAIEPLLSLTIGRVLNSDFSEWGERTAEVREAVQTAPSELKDCFNIGADIGYAITLSQFPPGLLEEWAASKPSDFTNREGYEAAQKLVAAAKRLGMLETSDSSNANRNRQPQRPTRGQGTNPYGFHNSHQPKPGESFDKADEACLLM